VATWCGKFQCVYSSADAERDDEQLTMCINYMAPNAFGQSAGLQVDTGLGPAELMPAYSTTSEEPGVVNYIQNQNSWDSGQNFLVWQSPDRIVNATCDTGVLRIFERE